MKCIQCAKEIEDQARYCPHCGAAQTPAPAKEEPEKKRPAALLRLAALAGELSLLSAAGVAALFIYYRLISETITVLYGAYLMLAAYLVMLWAAIARCFHRGRKT